VEQPERLFRGGRALKVSVVLPATNESVLLERTVAQLVATLPDRSEVIVVDNGSTDGCADFLAGGAWDNVHLLRSAEPLGVSAARNRGLAAARGEVVVFSDAHVDVPERWWEPLVRTLDLPDVGVVAPGIGTMGRPEKGAACGQRIAETNLRLDWLPRKSAAPCPVPTLGGGFMAMRRETLERAGAFDEGMPQWGSEDLELCVRYWLLGYEVWVVPEVTVLHYFRKARPYGVHWHLLTHNLLRVALLHFSRPRLARVTSALRNRTRFGAALAQLVESDVWQKRAELAARRVRDDDWLFERFKDICHV
jgi:GT2 family glycosyltransferase